MDDAQQTKRRLRLQIARRRRRIDGRLHAARRRGGELLSWQTYARRYPGSAVMAALGVGLVASAGLGRRPLARWIGLRLVRRAIDRLGRLFWRELEQVWADSAPHKGHSPDTGDDRERA